MLQYVLHPENRMRHVLVLTRFSFLRHAFSPEGGSHTAREHCQLDIFTATRSLIQCQFVAGSLVAEIFHAKKKNWDRDFIHKV